MSGRNKRGGGGGHGGGGEERWLLPYADMITLLLGLFIVLFAMSTIDAKQFDNLKRSLSQTFKGDVLTESGGVLAGATGVLSPTAANQSSDNSAFSRRRDEASDANAKRFGQEQEKLDKAAKAAAGSLAGTVSVSTDTRGIVISMAGDALFRSGSAELTPRAERTISKLAKELRAFGRPLDIEGHTDGAPINGANGFADNWMLSGARAYAVLHILERNGMPSDSMRATMRGDSLPRVRPAHRHDNVPKNRRVEIHVLAPGADGAGLPTAAEQKAAAGRSYAHNVVIAAKTGRPVDLDLHGKRGSVSAHAPEHPSVDVVGDIVTPIASASHD